MSKDDGRPASGQPALLASLPEPVPVQAYEGAGHGLIAAIFDGKRELRECADDLRSFARAMKRVGSAEGAFEIVEIADAIEAVGQRIQDAHGDLMAEESARTAQHFAGICELAFAVMEKQA